MPIKSHIKNSQRLDFGGGTLLQRQLDFLRE
jgi:hypothetical protein